MPFTPLFPNLAGLLPLLQNAKTIIERDIGEALTWSYGSATPGEVFKRVQFTQRHSTEYPLLIVQAAASSPQPTGAGGVLQSHVFDVEIFLTRDVSATGGFAAEVDTLAEDLIRYFDATVMAFISAPSSDWRANFPNDDEAGKVRVWCTNAVFGQLQQSREVAGKYLHSVAFELQIELTESQ